MAWTWRPEDLFLETLKDSLAQQRAWRHRGIAWRWPGARGQSGRGGDGGGAAAEAEAAEEAYPADYTAGTQHCLGAFEGIGSEIFTPGKYSNMVN
uniref:Uncharacterized protein n=1 Tax=Oryza barthii TaxID=65489 RepID=A0A0D3FKT5_9ORYZ